MLLQKLHDTTQRKSQVLLLLGCALVLVAAAVVFGLPTQFRERIGQTRNGLSLQRLDRETVRISWGTPSGVNISPRNTLEFNGFVLSASLDTEESHKTIWPLPCLSQQDGVWMHVIDPDYMESAVPASYVNPKLDDTLTRMYRMIELESEGRKNLDLLTRLAAQSYIYLGYAVLDEADAAALKQALSDRSGVDLEADIVTPLRTLYKLEPGVERQFVEDPGDKAALAIARMRIPVLFESINVEAGHPGDVMHVLYLDGHVEAIPYGERFPAVPEFMRLFPPLSNTER